MEAVNTQRTVCPLHFELGIHFGYTVGALQFDLGDHGEVYQRYLLFYMTTKKILNPFEPDSAKTD